MGCNCTNPATPQFAPGEYIDNSHCADDCKTPIYVPPITGGKTTEVIAGTDIQVDDISDTQVDRFVVSYNPYIALTAALNMQVYIAGLLQALPIAKGRIVDELRFTWSYNKTIVSQSLNLVGYNTFNYALNVRNAALTGLNITAQMNSILTGNDGRQNATDTEIVTFGNYQIWGDYSSMLGRPVSEIPTLISGLANKQQQIKTSRANSIYGTGGVNKKFFIIYPAAWGEAVFTKGIFVGGFQRLKNEAGTLVVTVAGTELPISWTNQHGYTEDVYVYQSLYDNIADAVEPIIIS